MSLSNQQLVENFYANVARGDIPAATDLFADELIWVEPPFPGHAGGVFHGKANILKNVLGPFIGTWDALSLSVDRVTPTPDGAIVHGVYRGRHKKTQRPFESRFVHTWTIQNAKAVRMEMLADTVQFFRTVNPDDRKVSNDPWQAGEFTDKAVLVTGSGRGIGQGIARFFALRGARVMLTARSKDELEATKASLPGARVELFAGDLTAGGTAKAVVEAALAVFGRLDILVTNAGAAPQGSFLELSEPDWPTGFGLKVFANLSVIKSAWPHLIESKGHLVMIGGGTARTPERHLSLVSAVNGAQAALSKTIAEQGLRDGIHVNLIQPGTVLTSRRTNLFAKLAGQAGISPDDYVRRLIERVGITRLGTPEDIAQVAGFLSTDASRWLHGAIIDVDGGQNKGT